VDRNRVYLRDHATNHDHEYDQVFDRIARRSDKKTAALTRSLTSDDGVEREPRRYIRRLRACSHVRPVLEPMKLECLGHLRRELELIKSAKPHADARVCRKNYTATCGTKSRRIPPDIRSNVELNSDQSLENDVPQPSRSMMLVCARREKEDPRIHHKQLRICNATSTGFTHAECSDASHRTKSWTDEARYRLETRLMPSSRVHNTLAYNRYLRYVPWCLARTAKSGKVRDVTRWSLRLPLPRAISLLLLSLFLCRGLFLFPFLPSSLSFSLYLSLRYSFPSTIKQFDIPVTNNSLKIS